MRPSQMEILNRAFAEIDAGNPKQAFQLIGVGYDT